MSVAEKGKGPCALTNVSEVVSAEPKQNLRIAEGKVP